MTKISLIVTAGGTSSRYGNKNKLLETVNGKTVIEHCIEKFLPIKDIFEIIIATNKDIIPNFEKIFADNNKIKIIQGGENRQESVYNGLISAQNPEFVLIHDGARPLTDTKKIISLIEKIKETKSAIIAVKTIDTIKKVDENGKIISTIDRSNLWNTQTPQGFEYKLILDAHKKLKGQNFTDDAGMLEHLGYPVFVVEGDYSNFKITTKQDLIRMKSIIEV